MIIAEGIETRPELEALRSLGVSVGQGYYLARPASLPIEWPTLASLSDSHD
ncbi:MAG: EAL domain-containing protein [Candidatus Limnocylindria bacterium]